MGGNWGVAGEAGLIVLEVEIDMAAGVIFHVAQLAAHPHIAEAVLDRALERIRELGNGQFHNIDARGVGHVSESLEGLGAMLPPFEATAALERKV